MKSKLALPMIMLLCFSFMAAIQPVSGNFSVNVYIKNAYYDDLDGDGLEDDIKVDATLYLDNNYIYTDVDLYIGITLPSGMDFWFKWSFTVKKYSYSWSKGMLFDLMNTALEEGWYQADAIGFAEGERFSYMDSLIFDPPGGQDGGDPIGFMSTY